MLSFSWRIPRIWDAKFEIVQLHNLCALRTQFHWLIYYVLILNVRILFFWIHEGRSDLCNLCSFLVVLILWENIAHTQSSSAAVALAGELNTSEENVA